MQPQIPAEQRGLPLLQSCIQEQISTRYVPQHQSLREGAQPCSSSPVSRRGYIKLLHAIKKHTKKKQNLKNQLSSHSLLLSATFLHPPAPYGRPGGLRATSANIASPHASKPSACRVAGNLTSQSSGFCLKL